MQENLLKIFFPGKLVFGNGTLVQLADDILQLNPSKVFIATIQPLTTAITGLTGALKKNNIRVLVDTSIVQEPTFSDFEKLLKIVSPFNPDIVVGIGGGRNCFFVFMLWFVNVALAQTIFTNGLCSTFNGCGIGKMNIA